MAHKIPKEMPDMASHLNTETHKLRFLRRVVRTEDVRLRRRCVDE